MLTEVAYFMDEQLPPQVLVAFLSDIVRGAYTVEDLLPEDYARAAEICEQYADARA